MGLDRGASERAAADVAGRLGLSAEDNRRRRHRRHQFQPGHAIRLSLFEKGMDPEDFRPPVLRRRGRRPCLRSRRGSRDESGDLSSSASTLSAWGILCPTLRTTCLPRRSARSPTSVRSCPSVPQGLPRGRASAARGRRAAGKLHPRMGAGPALSGPGLRSAHSPGGGRLLARRPRSRDRSVPCPPSPAFFSMTSGPCRWRSSRCACRPSDVLAKPAPVPMREAAGAEARTRAVYGRGGFAETAVVARQAVTAAGVAVRRGRGDLHRHLPARRLDDPLPFDGCADRRTHAASLICKDRHHDQYRPRPSRGDPQRVDRRRRGDEHHDLAHQSLDRRTRNPRLLHRRLRLRRPQHSPSPPASRCISTRCRTASSVSWSPYPLEEWPRAMSS